MGLGPLTEHTEAGEREGGRGTQRERGRERERQAGTRARGRVWGYPALPVMISTSPQRARLVALGPPPAVTADGLLNYLLLCLLPETGVEDFPYGAVEQGRIDH